MTTHSKTKTPKKKPSIPPKRRHHKQPTREKIIEAATRVFADYPYSSASIRMIGKAAGIEHPLISYYFPSKAALFEEVLSIASEEYYNANISWFEGLAKQGPEKGLALYLDRFIDFALKHPHPLRIITLNLVPAEKSEIIPGYRLIQNFFERTTATFREKIRLNGSSREIDMLTMSFNTLAVNYLGAEVYYAGILGMEPGSRKYYEWVRASMIFIILPRLKQLLNNGAA